MSRSSLADWAAFALLGAVLLAPSALSAHRAHASARSAADRLAETRTALADLAAVRRTAQRLVHPAGPLSPRISGALARAGLAASALTNLSPEPPMTVGATTRQRATLTLVTTLPQLGSFLAVWRRDEPDWTVTSIELAPQQGGTATPGADLPLRIIIILDGLIESPPGAPGGAGDRS